ncbi:MAG: DNA alkylation repair protein [bacterium]|nr:DNA alkylation repair protein [bacterium]
MGKIKNKYHSEILRELKKNLKKTTQANRDFEKRYVGTDKICYSVRTADKEKTAKNFLKAHKGLSTREFVLLLNSLYAGKSFEEVVTAGKLLEFSPDFKKQMDIWLLDKWLNLTCGWCEVDSLCQANFGAELILNRWPEWKALLEKFFQDKNIHKRRASLVLLTKSTRESADPRLAKMTFANIEKLKSEKRVLITKAISWLLRSLTKHHKKEVAAYLKKNQGGLPKIAVRETLRKLETGRK